MNELDTRNHADQDTPGICLADHYWRCVLEDPNTIDSYKVLREILAKSSKEPSSLRVPRGFTKVCLDRVPCEASTPDPEVRNLVQEAREALSAQIDAATGRLIQNFRAGDLMALGVNEEAAPLRLSLEKIESAWWSRPTASVSFELGKLRDRRGGKNILCYSGIRILDTAEAEAWQKTQTVPIGRKRGPKLQYDWSAFRRHIVQLAEHPDGLTTRFNSQAELVRHMLEWCQKEWGTEPSESMLKKEVSDLWPD